MGDLIGMNENDAVQERFDAILEQAKHGTMGQTTLDRCAKQNDMGIATLFNYLYKDEIVHVTDLDKWFKWNGVYWESIEYGDLIRALQTVGLLLAARIDDVVFAKDGDLKEKKTDEAKSKEHLIVKLEAALAKTQTANGIKNVISVSDGTTAVPPLALKSTTLDTDPYILCVQNGVIELKSGEMREARRDDHCTFCAPVEWQGLDAPRPKWEATVKEILGGNDDAYHYFQRLMGMAIVGKVLEKNFLLLFGEEGDSGKTTIFEILFGVLGGYAAPMPVELLLDSGMPTNPNAPTPAIMDLRGKRICWASEPADNRRFSVDRIKLMSGGDTLTARSPYGKENITFSPSHTLFMLSNNEPHASASDSAFWKRLRQIDCPFEFVENPTKLNQKKVDRTLKDTILKEEASGVLAWLVQGFIEYNSGGGSNPPECIMKATADYREREDKILMFKKDCIVEKQGEEISGQDLYDKFKKWHEKLFGRAPSIQWFGKEAKRHFTTVRSGTVKYVDVVFNDYADSLNI